MEEIHNFNDLIKHFGSLDKFIENWYDAYIDEQFITILGDEITSDDLLAIFKDNDVLITNAENSYPILSCTLIHLIFGINSGSILITHE